jgi:hypothetical protein
MRLPKQLTAIILLEFRRSHITQRRVRSLFHVNLLKEVADPPTSILHVLILTQVDLLFFPSSFKVLITLSA